MAQKKSQASAQHGKPSRGVTQSNADRPKKGEHYRCARCGMEIDVTAECHCQGEEGPHFECCGQELARV